MKYELEETISAPRDQVIRAFTDQNNLKEWQPSLVSIETLKGDGMKGVGSQTRQVHKMGKREVAMISTVTAEEPPAFYAATFEADGVWNLIENRFDDMGDGTTRWRLMSEFQCKGLVMKLMMRLAPGMFRKQTRDFMGHFKAFAEGRGLA